MTKEDIFEVCRQIATKPIVACVCFILSCCLTPLAYAVAEEQPDFYNRILVKIQQQRDHRPYVQIQEPLQAHERVEIPVGDASAQGSRFLEINVNRRMKTDFETLLKPYKEDVMNYKQDGFRSRYDKQWELLKNLLATETKRPRSRRARCSGLSLCWLNTIGQNLLSSSQTGGTDTGEGGPGRK